MAHNLAIDEESGEHCFVVVGNRESAWHGLGQRVDQAMTWAEAYKLAHLDYEVIKAPLANSLVLRDYIAELREIDPLQLVQAGEAARRIESSLAGGMSYGIFRADTLRQLGTVSENYAPIQNKDAFSFTDSLIEGGEVRYESAGALGGGERIWVLAKTNRQLRVPGTDDVSDCFLLFTTAHDGTAAAVCKVTTVRVVCNNTLTMALGERGQEVSIRHTGDVLNKISDAREALRRSMHAFDELQGQIEELAQRVLTKELFVSCVQAMFPMNPEAKSQKKRLAQIEKMAARFESNDNNFNPLIRGTALNLANAAVEYADFDRLCLRSKQDDPLYNTDMPEGTRRELIRKRSNTFGGGAQFKLDAWNAVLALTADAPKKSLPSQLAVDGLRAEDSSVAVLELEEGQQAPQDSGVEAIFERLNLN